jgi:hypothetical protein
MILFVLNEGIVADLIELFCIFFNNLQQFCLKVSLERYNL